MYKLEKTKQANVYFRHFWPIGTIGHVDSYMNDNTRGFLADLFSDVSKEVPVIIDSHFSQKSLNKKIAQKLTRSRKKRQQIAFEQDLSLEKTINALYVWYTPENKRPPLHLPYDIFLSHDLDPYFNRNIYLPFWVTKLGSNLNQAQTVQSNLLSKRYIDKLPAKFACAVISNPEPVRMEFLKLLSSIGAVDLFGKFGTRLKSKSEISNQYRFNLCFENSIYPGYVTEKLIESWNIESIPIWSGSDKGDFFNSRAIINVAEMGFDKSLEKIRYLESHPEEISSILSEPILRKPFDIDQMLRDIHEILEKRIV